MSKLTLHTSSLHNVLLTNIEQATSIYILTSFVMESGVKLLVDALKRACERGAEVKICAGDYLYITQPTALSLLHSIHPNIEIRLFRSAGRSFHPKAYMMDNDYNGSLIVGSSNLSQSALRSGVEWNLQVEDEIHTEVFQKAQKEFIMLFEHEQTISVNELTIKEYEAEWNEKHREVPALEKFFTDDEEIELMLPTETEEQPETGQESVGIYGEFQPRDAQIEALQQLHQTREEGYNKALIVMATGLGKTYLSAFFAKEFKRVLFIAHREEILLQAKKTFESIFPEKIGGIYNGNNKENNVDFVFASIYTLSMKRHLQVFEPNEFDLIIVDEFHHAAANTYQKVLNYFLPEFLLGITATPDRNDNKDIYSICEGNVPYRMDFLQAIQRQWLSPFAYYGILDTIDYSTIKWLGNKYDPNELTIAQIQENVAENIYQAWLKHKQTRTLVFCSSIKQAKFLVNYFANKGHNVSYLIGESSSAERKNTIEKLHSNEIEAIFTVDLFNEGVDIPSVDTVLLVRPTESLTVFIQQLGRGLRLAPQKEICHVIDLIGNYRNADVKLQMIGDNRFQKGKKKTEYIAETPDSCSIHLDIEVVNLLDEMYRKRQPRKEQIRDCYFKVKSELGRRPTYQEIEQLGSEPGIVYKQEFGGYYAFLHYLGELSEREEAVYLKYEEWFVKELEATTMTKSYKMVLLLAMLERGPSEWFKPITAEEVAPFFYDYYNEKAYRKLQDFSNKKHEKIDSPMHPELIKTIGEMPMTKWSGASKNIVKYDGKYFWFDLDVSDDDAEILYEFTREVCEFRVYWYFKKKESL